MHTYYCQNFKILNSKMIKPEEMPYEKCSICLWPRYIHTVRSKDNNDIPGTCSKTHEGIKLSG